jgi:hypothetical protein
MDDFRNLWQSQEVEEMKISITELRAKATAFETRIRRRNLREQVACLFVIVAFGWAFFKSPATVPRIGFGLFVAGAIYVAWHLRAKGTANALPADIGSANCLEFYRKELEKQRDLLQDIWKWYLGPLIPGMAILVVGGILNAPPDRRWFSSTYAVFCVALFWGIGQFNFRAARRLSQQIEDLKLYTVQDGLDPRG